MKDRLIEDLSAIEHERWSDWMVYLLDRKASRFDDPDDPDIGYYILSVADVEHWRRLIATPYAELPEYSKQSDRDEVARYLPLLVEFVAGWIGANVGGGRIGEIVAEKWREDMA